MTNKLKKLIYVGVVLIVCVGTLCACNGAYKYDAKLFNDIENYLQDDFIKQNRTLGAFYYENLYFTETDTWEDTVMQVKEGPEIRDYIISSQEMFSTVFKSFPCEVNFESDIIIIHLYTSNKGSCKLKKIKIEDKNLFVEFRIQQNTRPFVNTGSMPIQKCIAIKMNKTEINLIKFEEK